MQCSEFSRAGMTSWIGHLGVMKMQAVLDDAQLFSHLTSDASESICVMPSPTLVRKLGADLAQYMRSQAEAVSRRAGSPVPLVYAVPFITAVAQARNTQVSTGEWMQQLREGVRGDDATPIVDVFFINPGPASAVTAVNWAISDPVSRNRSQEEMKAGPAALVMGPDAPAASLLIQAFLSNLSNDSSERRIRRKEGDEDAIHPAVNQETWHYLVIASTVFRLAGGRVFVELWTDTPNCKAWRSSRGHHITFNENCQQEPVFNLKRENSTFQRNLGFPDWLLNLMLTPLSREDFRQELLRTRKISESPPNPKAPDRAHKRVVVDANRLAGIGRIPKEVLDHFHPEALIQVPTSVIMEVARKAIFLRDRDPSSPSEWSQVQSPHFSLPKSLISERNSWLQRMSNIKAAQSSTLSGAGIEYLEHGTWKWIPGIADLLFVASWIDAVNWCDGNTSRVYSLTRDGDLGKFIDTEKSRLNSLASTTLAAVSTSGEVAP